ncbi:MAG: hypothetical protein KA072_10245 [Thermoanaerobaculaceae bacterium]|nr:hypothetical protein [Thermoanaerobaculaceae bacterium]MDI9621107.1 hypothetical protein [Acidobacteriota bacterium]NLH09927.1 hypothetical protein [Holophagae bacterium]HPW55542.1 hypothetical protein [Thermoanaerobaculaceae bacterium]
MSARPEPWWRHLKGDPLPFLLSDHEPGVAWRALQGVLGQPADAPAVARARLAAREHGAAAAVLIGQSEFGTWGSPTSYAARWGGAAWRIMALAPLGADPEDPRVARGVEALLEILHPRSGGFATTRKTEPSPCFSAQLCASLVRLGYAHHPRVREAIAWVASLPGPGWRCGEARHDHGGGCVVTPVAVLRLVSEHVPSERARLAPLAARAGSVLVERELFLHGSAPRGWFSFAHPCLDRADLLEALVPLARLGWPPEPAILAGLLAVLARQDGQGRWTQQLAAPFGEPAGQPGRWVTLKALVVLSVFGAALGAARGGGG